MRASPGRASFVLAFALGALGCHGDPERAPAAGSGVPRTNTPDGGVVVDSGGNDPAGPPNCGGQTLPAVVDQPVLYFVFDRSGSMTETMPGTDVTRYQAALQAVGEALQPVGNRARYGAAVYPLSGSNGSCGAGEEVFAPEPGDPLKSDGSTGPVLKTFLNRLRLQTPQGSTPTAATLRALRPTLQALGGTTSVVLVTDGAPNCNARARCDSSKCIPDLERAPIGDELCGDRISCCDPAEVGTGAGANCIDDDGAEAAVSELAALGIPTYVVGLPGSETYAAVLDRLARAGGVPNSGSTAYFATTDSASLSSALYDIGAGVSIPCEIELPRLPADLSQINVYFDGEAVPFDPEQGWSWLGDAAVALRGTACETLQSGALGSVQVVYGCQTIVR